MPHRREVAKRKILPDPKFQDRLLAKFINDMMRKGEKSVAERVAYKALDLVQQRTNDDPLKVFKKALDNVKPVLEVKSRRVGGATYQVPVEVRQERRVALAMPGLAPARVIAEHRSSLTLLTEAGEMPGIIPGHLRHQAGSRSELPAVGDWVAIKPSTGTVQEALPRTSAFVRRAAGRETEEQVV